LITSSLPFLTAGLFAALLAEPVLAQGEKVSSAVELARQAYRLKPEQWVWEPQISPQGPPQIFASSM
jgi:hypothetical protein